MPNRLTSLLIALRQSLLARIIAGLIVFYFLFAWLAVNPLAKWLLPWVAETRLASKASVEKVVFDPFQLTATIDHFALTEKSGAPLASFDKLVVDLEFSGLLHWAWKLKQVALTAPQVNVHVSKQGKLNWADFIAKLNEDPSPPSPDLPRVIVDNIDIRQGDIEYKDDHHPTPLQASLKPLDFELDGFSTLPQDRGDYLIAAKLPYQGGTLKWKGDFGVNPLASKGSLAIEGLQIAKVMQWVNAQSLPFQAESGTFSSQFKYDFSLPNQQPKLLLADARLALNAVGGKLAQGDHLALNQLELLIKQLVLEQQPHTVVTTQAITLNLDQLKLQKPQADFSLASASLSLPRVNFSTKETVQVAFDALNVQLNQLQLHHQQRTLFQLPQLTVEQVGLDLAERQASISKIALADGQLSATSQANGLLDWQQVFATPAPQADSNTADTTATAPPAAAEKESSPFHVTIGEIALSHWQLAYLDQQFAKPLQASVADFNLHLALDQQAGLQLSNIQVDANKLTVQSDKKPVAQLASLALTDGSVVLDTQKASLGTIQLSGLKTSVIRQADQRLNWQAMLSPANSKNTPPSSGQHKEETRTAASPAAAKRPAWEFGLKRFALQHADIHIEDQTTATPMQLDVTEGRVEVAGLSQNMARPLPVKAGFKVKQGGQFNAQGKLSPAPFATSMQLSLVDLSLKPFAPYIQQVAMLNLQDGSASTQGKLQQTAKGSTTFDGGFSVSRLSLVEESSQEPFMRWEKLQGDGLALSLAPNRLQLNTLTLTKPQTKFIIHPDRSLNITKVLRSNKPAENTAGTETSASTPVATATSSTDTNTAAATDTNSSDFPVAIDTVRINDAELEFADLSLPQPFGTHIHSLGGVINGISSNPAATAQVELDGKVDDYGSARIRGALQPFKTTEFTDIKLAFTNLEMNRLTPYSGKFAGRKIESGKLSVDLEYKIKQRKLAGENKFVIQKLTLGEKVDSKDAANLPLDLAIAIMEDSDGVIDLDLPISGSLDDPKFSYGSILWKAFTNVMTKIVTAPFSALGKLFGSSEKLEAIVFDPGKSAIAPPELEKLHAVSTALGKRQQLKLGIVPGYDTAADTRAIQELTLRAQVAEEMGARPESGQAAGPIDLNNPKVQSAIQALHDRLTNKGLLKRLAAKLEKAPAGFYEQAQEALTTSIQVSEADLQTLAKTRAQAIAKALQEANVSPERVEIVAPVTVKADHEHVPSKLTLGVIKH
ncbi:protein of unknown function [Methylophilus rhizosphaerae]|uniref:DUF748 domain-containing protein n=1 Tax=Methylophilus rhizosphaerae TaxID=492660 RepID=A0A1G8ZXY9_9PROT|nr:DUF748 domain-containing protein [Methylophilus rhizosphaerae]SDK19807.1 protein of unknown function [Methylophilus rhizosphaerae]